MVSAAEKPALSYAKGPDSPELFSLCIGQVLDRTAASFPSGLALAVRHTHDRFTWAELRDRVELVARGLMSLGIRKGDRVGIWATNCTEWVLIQFATAKIGAILVNVNPSYRAHELEFALKQSECQTLVMIQGFRDCDYVDTLMSVAPELQAAEPLTLSSARLPYLRNVIFVGEDAPASMLPWDHMLSLAAQISVGDLRQRESSLDPHDPVNIQYTSGTTGAPKGATLSHCGVVNNGLLIGNAQKLTSADKVCIPVPFYHCFGMVLGNMACLTHGASMVIPAAYFDPVETLRAVEHERCTALYGVPTMFIAEMQRPEFPSFDLSSLRTGIMAGSSCPIELMRRVVTEMHCNELTIAYGLTESSPVITQTSTDDPLELRVTTVGRVHPHTEVKIVNPRTGRVVPRGEVGELCTRGYLVMNGYYNNPGATAQVIEPDGWLHSGDLATIDADGYVRITGRIKEMIIRGGENIYPREIEEFLHTFPDVADVQIIGVPDPKYGEELLAWVKLKRGSTIQEEDIREYCRGKIARYKIPRYVRFVDSFPMTVTGKIQKFRMREISIAEMSAVKEPSVTPGHSAHA